MRENGNKINGLYPQMTHDVAANIPLIPYLVHVLTKNKARTFYFTQ